jgi:hypothetical protein
MPVVLSALGAVAVRAEVLPPACGGLLMCPTPGSGRILPTPTSPTIPTPTSSSLPTPSPSPTTEPGPGPTPGPGPLPPVPAPQVGIPTDVGFGALASKVYAGAGWFAPQLYPMLTTSTPGDSSWFMELYRRMENIGALLLLLFLVLGVVTALIQRDAVLMLKVPFLYLPIAIGVTVLAIQLTQTLMAIVDGFTVYMLQGVGDDLSAMLTHAAAILLAGAAGAALGGQMTAVALLAAGVLLLGLLGIAIELLARTAAIYVCLAFMPVTAACLLWPKLAHLPKLLAEVLVGLILLKWVVAVVLVLGAKALSANPFTMGPQGDPGFVSIVMGAVIVVIALASPLALVRIIPFVEGQALGNWSGQARGLATRAASRIGPRFTQGGAALQRGAGAARARLPVASREGTPRILMLPRGSSVFVRSPRPAPAPVAGGRRRRAGSGVAPAPAPPPPAQGRGAPSRPPARRSPPPAPPTQRGRS